MSGWISDLGYSLRRLLRAPGFTFTSVVLLALTMSVVIVLFGIVYGIFYKPLPYAEPDRLVTVMSHLIRENRYGRMNAEEVQLFANHPEIFQREGGFSGDLEWLSNGPGSEPTELHLMYIEPEVFEIFEMHPVAGRLPDRADTTARSPRHALVTEGFARERYGSAGAAIGQPLALHSAQYQIIGVLPEYPLFRDTVLWVPSLYTPEQLAESAGLGYPAVPIVGRLAPGVSPTEAGRRLTALAMNDPRLASSPYAKDVQIVAAPFRSLWTWPQERLLLHSLFAAALALWLITVSNVCNLYIARLAGRQHESGLMSALGASPRRILWLHAQDALVIAGAALGIALALASWEFTGVRLYKEFPDSPYPLQLDPAGVGFALLLALLLAAALLANAWWMERRRGATQQDLKIGGARHSAPREVRFLRTALSVLQVTLTAVLLAGAGLLLRSAQHALHEDLGFDREHLLMTGINLPGPPDEVAFEDLINRFAERIRVLPQIREMTRSNCNPLGFLNSVPYQPPGSQDADVSHWAVSTFCPETASNFFSVLHIPVVQGRPFNDQEVRERAPVAIVDADFARKNFPDGQVLGRTIRISGTTAGIDSLNSDANSPPPPITTLTIVGVVPRVTMPWTVLHPDTIFPYVYTPGPRGLQLLLRTTAGLGPLSNDLKKVVRQLTPRGLLGSTQFATDVIGNAVRSLYPANSALSLLAAVTLLLAAVGLYAMLAYSTEIRQKEFAIRLALGESPPGLRRSVVRQGLKSSGLGLVLAIPLIWLTGQALQSQLYRVRTFDPLTIGAVAMVVVIATLAATWWPARRAERADPMQALRAE
ncbi:MAG TPA: ABC transporter permease [Steroidobacteraceae bacterium]|nr:ABC transporter permease [Steroidobacteraceae bacterium]